MISDVKRVNAYRTVAVVLLAMLSLSACKNEVKNSDKGGQSLVRVNGEEITVHQLNEEMTRNNVTPEQKDVASKQLLESLIDRQLVQEEAKREKVDRDPIVMQAIERAKTQIMVQAYMQKRVANIAKPTSNEIESYFLAHPEFFTERKAYELSQIIFSTKDFSPELKAAMGSMKSLDDTTAWLTAHKVEFTKGKIMRNSVDIPVELNKRLNALRKGQLFALQEADKTIVMDVSNSKELPVAMEQAKPQIAQFLANQKAKEASDAEVARLRKDAKIEYLGKLKEEKKAEPKKEEKSDDESTKRGVKGL